jgi:hypothetical protein
MEKILSDELLINALHKHRDGIWIHYCDVKKNISRIFENDIDGNGFLEIQSDYQDKGLLSMVVDSIFENLDVNAIITNKYPDEDQNIPLYNLGFKERNENQMILEKLNWKQ